MNGVHPFILWCVTNCKEISVTNAASDFDGVRATIVGGKGNFAYLLQTHYGKNRPTVGDEKPGGLRPPYRIGINADGIVEKAGPEMLEQLYLRVDNPIFAALYAEWQSEVASYQFYLTPDTEAKRISNNNVYSLMCAKLGVEPNVVE